MTVRSVLAIGALAAVVAGCATSYVVVPATGGRVAAASAAGISLAAYPNTWDGDPEDLPDYLTPIWIDIVNQTSQTLRIRYQDFALTDQSRFRYAAVSPYSGQPQVSRSSKPQPSKPQPPAPATTPAAAPRPSEPAAPAPAAPEQPSGTPSAPPSGGNAQPPPATATPIPGGGLTDETSPWLGSPDDESGARILLIRDGRRGGGGFRGHGGFRSGFHTHIFIGPGPFFYEPWWPYWRPYPYYYGPYYYGPYVYSWNYRYYPGAPSADILRLGLPEGELQPGGRVSGFVYFQQATRRPGHLELTWSVHTVGGRSVESISVPLVVVEN
jgi:hypothetical protein